jgi:5-methylcytosine-specific restriction endonuclease McrBC regulatory subunit McrC
VAIQAEEWEGIPVGHVDGLSRTDLALLTQAFRAYTGKDASDFFDFGTTTVKPKNWLGTLSAGKAVLEVVPRGAKSLSEPLRARLDENIGTIIRIAMERDVIRLGEAEFSASASHFERGVEALCDLVLAARRRRILRAYSVYTEESSALRGRLRFPEQSLLAIERPGFFASEWTDLDEDHPVARFLKGALELLRLRVGGYLRQRVEGVLAELDRVPESDLALVAPAAGWRSRVPCEYGQAVDLAEELLEGRGVGLLAGSTYARTDIVVTPPAFERFVERLTRDVAAAVGLRTRFKPGGRYLAQWVVGPTPGALAAEVIPDAEVRSSRGETVVIVDAKWKELVPTREGLGVASSDLYQMLAYATRLACGNAVLVYPWTGASSPFEEPPCLLLKHSAGELRVRVFALPLLWDDFDGVRSELASALTPTMDMALA